MSQENNINTVSDFLGPGSIPKGLWSFCVIVFVLSSESIFACMCDRKLVHITHITHGKYLQHFNAFLKLKLFIAYIYIYIYIRHSMILLGVLKRL